MEVDSKCLRPEAHGEQLLPGIPDTVTLDVITPKLPWISLQTLSSISRAWRFAIQSHEVYEARGRFQSTETLVLVNYFFNRGLGHAIALYSTKDFSKYELPPIPGVPEGIPMDCQCVSLNGRVYVLGGEDGKGDGITDKDYRDTVYVFDVAGQRGWKRCAGMKQPRKIFGCGVVDGKIYVVGGASIRRTPPDIDVLSSHECEVYDPEEDKWCSVAPLISSQPWHHVETGREEFVVHGRGVRFVNSWNFQLANTLDPLSNDWKKFEPLGRCHVRHFFAGGKLYAIRWHPVEADIQVYDAESKSWSRQHSFSFAPSATRSARLFWRFRPGAILVVNGALLVKVNACYGSVGVDHIIQFDGFGGERERIVGEWKLRSFGDPTVGEWKPRSFGDPTMYIRKLIMYPIEL